MFDTYGLNIYPVLTNPEIRVDFSCPPGWNCKKPTESITVLEDENKTHCDYPLECGFGTPNRTPNPGETPDNQCELNTYTINQIISRGLNSLAPRLRIGNDEQTVTCADFGFEDNGRSETIDANHFWEPIPAVQIGGGTIAQVQSIVCGVAGPIQVTYQHPSWLIGRDTAKAKANARAKAAAKLVFQSKIASGEYPFCDPLLVDWVISTRFGGDTVSPGCTGSRNILSADGIYGTPWPDDPTNYTLTNHGSLFELEVHANTNRDRVGSILDSTCPGWVCGFAGTNTFWSTAEIGPFPEDRQITAVVAGELQAAPIRDFDFLSGCGPSPDPGFSASTGTIVVSGSGEILADNSVSIASAQSPKVYAFTLTGVLSAGNKAHIHGIIFTGGPGTVSRVKVSLGAAIVTQT